MRSIAGRDEGIIVVDADRVVFSSRKGGTNSVDTELVKVARADGLVGRKWFNYGSHFCVSWVLFA